MYSCAVYQPYVEVSALTSSEYEALCAVVLHLVEQSETFDEVWSLVKLPASALDDIGLVDLAVVPACLAHLIPVARLSERMSADAAGINSV